MLLLFFIIFVHCLFQKDTLFVVNLYTIHNKKRKMHFENICFSLRDVHRNFLLWDKNNMGNKIRIYNTTNTISQHNASKNIYKYPITF